MKVISVIKQRRFRLLRCLVLGMLSWASTSVSAQTPDSTNGIYSGSGVVPNNTKAEIEGQFTLGAPVEISSETGTYMLLNKTNKRLNLVSQGFVRMGDLNHLTPFPAWLVLNSEAGVIQSYAHTDQLFQIDSFYYSMHRGGFQLPNNIYLPPAYFTEDRGLLYFNSATNKLVLWDGSLHRPVTTDDSATKSYQILTQSGPIGQEGSNIVYAQPSSSGMIISLPHSNDMNERIVIVKNISASHTIQVSPTIGDNLNGQNNSITLAPNQSAHLHAMPLGWQQL